MNDPITPERLLSQLDELCAYLIDHDDYRGSSIAEKLKKELDMFLELQRVRDI
jgi:hypothetical protein